MIKTDQNVNVMGSKCEISLVVLILLISKSSGDVVWNGIFVTCHYMLYIVSNMDLFCYI